MLETRDEARHVAECEDGPAECAKCARIVAGRAEDARVREENEERAVREALGWLARA